MNYLHDFMHKQSGKITRLGISVRKQEEILAGTGRRSTVIEKNPDNSICIIETISMYKLKDFSKSKFVSEQTNDNLEYILLNLRNNLGGR